MKFMRVTWFLWGLATAAKQPNILFILTDDQGKLIGGIDHMPKLQVRDRNFPCIPRFSEKSMNQ
jgi:hypothetical protein